MISREIQRTRMPSSATTPNGRRTSGSSSLRHQTGFGGASIASTKPLDAGILPNMSSRVVATAVITTSVIVGVALLSNYAVVQIGRGMWADETGNAGYTTGPEMVMFVAGLVLSIAPLAALTFIFVRAVSRERRLLNGSHAKVPARLPQG